MIPAIKFRELINALEASQRLSDWGAEGVAMRNLERFLLSHADALLALVEAHKSKTVLLDGDERTTVRIFTPHEETKP